MRIPPLVAALACLLLAPIARAPQSLAQSWSLEIEYEEPADPALGPIYQRLKQWGTLEKLQEFLEPLRLPRQLTVKTTQCGANDVPYEAGGPVRVCYELMDQIASMVAQRTPDKEFQQTVIVGALTQAVLHEMAQAMFDVLQIPVWGREEDAADRLAAFLMVQFGEDVANQTMRGTAQLFRWSDQKWTGSDFSSTASPDYQRFFNFACIAVARDYVNFGGWVERGLIPERRAERCEDEYREIQKAFNLRIMPYVDPDLLVSMRFKSSLKWAPNTKND
jgi:putative metallopeptidase DUF4344